MSAKENLAAEILTLLTASGINNVDFLSRSLDQNKAELKHLQQQLNLKIDIVNKLEAVKAKHDAYSRDYGALPEIAVKAIAAAEEIHPLRAMFNNTGLLPDCAERTVLYLLSHFQFEDVKEDEDESFLDSDTVNEYFATLGQHFRDEEAPNSVLKIYDQLITLTQRTKPGPKFVTIAIRVLNSLVKAVRPMDIDLLCTLIGNTQTAAKAIAGQDIILLLGGTGAGKSTTIQFLAGSTMAMTEVNDLDHIGPVEYLYPEMESFKTSPHAAAETMSINAVTVKLKDFGIDSDDTITLCDSPGFNDTRGVEVDIANGIGISSAVRGCKSVKLFIINSDQFGNRMESMASIAATLVLLLDDIQAHLPTLSYGFTKFSKRKGKIIHAKLKDLVKQLSPKDKSDASFSALLGDIVAKTDNNAALIIDPIEDKPAPLLEYLRSSSRIDNPSEVFKDFLNPSSMDTLRNQISIQQSSIRTSLRSKKVDIVVFRMRQLQSLSNIGAFPDVESACEECRGDIRRVFKDHFSRLHHLYDRILNVRNNDVAEELSELSKLGPDMVTLERLRQLLFPDLPNLTTAFTAKVTDMQSKLSAEFLDIFSFKGFGEKDIGLTRSVVLFGKVQSIFTNLSVLRDKDLDWQKINFFEGINEVYQVCLSRVTDQFDCAKALAASTSKLGVSEYDDNISSLIMSWDFMKLLADQFQPLVADMNFDSLYKLSVESMELGTRSKSAITGLKAKDLSTAAVQEAYATRQLVDLLTSCDGINQHIPMVDILAMRSDIDESSTIAANNRLQTVEDYFTACTLSTVLSANTIHGFRALIDVVDCLIDNFDRGMLWLVQYQKCTSLVKKCISQNSETVNTNVRLVMLHKPCAANYFGSALANLEVLSVFDGHKSSVYNSEFENCMGLLSNFVAEMVKDTNNCGIDLEEHSLISSVYKNLVVAKTFLNCSDKFEHLLKELSVAEADFAERVNVALGNVINVFENPQFSHGNALNGLSLCCVVQSVELPDVHAMLGEVVTCIEEFLENFSASYELRLSTHFECLFNPADLTLNSSVSSGLSILMELNLMVEFYRDTRVPDCLCGQYFDFYTQIFDTHPAQLFEVYFNDEEPRGVFNAVHDEFSRRRVLALNEKDVPNLEGLLIHVQFFNLFDRFLGEDYKFSSLCTSIKHSISDTVQVLKGDIKMKVVEKLYEDTAMAFAAVKLNESDKSEIRGFILDNLKSTLSSLSHTTAELRTESISLNSLSGLFVEMSKIDVAEKYLYNIINDSTATSSLRHQLIEVRHDIQLAVNGMLELSNKYMDNLDFHNAETLIRKPTELFVLFKDMRCLIDDADVEISFVNWLEGQILLFKEQLKGAVHDILDSYRTDVDLTEFSKVPPIMIFTQLRKAAVDFKEPYTEGNVQLGQLIKTQIEKQLNGAKDVSIDVLDQKISLTESITTFLPPDVYGSFSGTLKSIKEWRDAFVANETFKIDEAVRAGNFTELIDLLQHHASLGNYNLSKAAKSSARFIVKNANASCREELKKGNIVALLDNLPAVWSDSKCYLDAIAGLLKSKKMDMFSDKECLTLCNELKDLVNAKVNGDMTLFLVATAFQKGSLRGCDKMFYQIVAALKAKKLIPTFFQHLDDGNVSLSLTKMYDCFMHHQKGFDKELLQENAVELKIFLDVSQEVKLFHETFFNFVDTDLFSDLSLTFEDLNSCLSYDGMVERITATILAAKAVVDVPYLHNEKAGSHISQERDSFFKSISQHFCLLRAFTQLAVHINSNAIDLPTIEKTCREHILSELSAIESSCEGSLNHIVLNGNEIEYKSFNVWLDNLRSFNDNFDEIALRDVAKGKKVLLEQRFCEILKAMGAKVSQSENMRVRLDTLVQMKSVTMNIPAFKKFVDAAIDGCLEEVCADNHEVIALMVVQLSSYSSFGGIPKMIINEHKAFLGYSRYLRNKKTATFTVQDVVNGMKGSDAINKTNLLQLYANFEVVYWQLVDDGLLDIDGSLEKMSNYVNSSELLEKSFGYGDMMTSLIAHVFAYWTLENSKGCMDKSNDGSSENAKNSLLQPHSAQVVSVFQLLGLDGDVNPSFETLNTTVANWLCQSKAMMSTTSTKKSDEFFENHLVQIGTGEGKSVTLAVTSTVLALVGFSVDCACYSEYLSKRDYESFQTIFTGFAVDKYVAYGTFNKLCEDFININGNARSLVESHINGTHFAVGTKGVSERPRVLLIDEVDVFFKEDFYGNFYRPFAELRHHTINSLVEYAWKNRNDRQLTREITKSEAYKACVSHYGAWGRLIEENVKDMMTDLQIYTALSNFTGFDHMVCDDKICYKDLDGISFSLHYGFKTIFAYFKEHENEKISAAARDSNVRITLDCGSFSYAEIPKQYQYVMGVSGTLAQLSAPEKALLTDEYRINKHTYMPSVYRESNCSYDENSSLDLMLVPPSDFHMSIVNEINSRMKPLDTSTTKRAVMVYFANSEEMLSFYNSPSLLESGLKEQVLYMDVGMSDIEKEGIIRKAATSGAITLCNKVFGRGTDFICYDSKLIQSGGIHVVQAFLSKELAEEVQIKGRTARQGDVGSFSMLLNEASLAKMHVSADELLAMKAGSKNRYRLLNSCRSSCFKAEFELAVNKKVDLTPYHVESNELLNALVHGINPEFVQNFILKRNEGVTKNKFCRTIILLDATSSMEELLSNAKFTVSMMFERVNKILDDNNCSTTMELQFGVFRNYNAPEDLLFQTSDWEFSARGLENFVTEVVADFGWGKEALEIGLLHVREQHAQLPVDQVIVIGDQSANERDDVDYKRADLEEGFGEEYWSETKYAKPTYFEEEVDSIVKLGIPVHAFYLEDKAKNCFTDLANRTGGSSASLDIQSPSAAEQLTALVSSFILKNAGGDRGDALVNAYFELFGGRGYVVN